MAMHGWNTQWSEKCLKRAGRVEIKLTKILNTDNNKMKRIKRIKIQRIRFDLLLLFFFSQITYSLYWELIEEFQR